MSRSAAAEPPDDGFAVPPLHPPREINRDISAARTDRLVRM
jgi:hypothetical protein